MSNSQEYKKYVELGKDLVGKIAIYQIKIAEYAVKVCDIKHGGISKNFYTIKDYANDIGLPHKSVQNWVSAYRNVAIKLDKPIETKEDWGKVNKTNTLLRMQTTVNNIKNNTPGKINARSVSKRKVQNLFDSIDDNEKPFVMEMNRITKSSKYALGVILKRDLKIVSDDELSHLMVILDKTSDVINDYLTKKQKGNRSA